MKSFLLAINDYTVSRDAVQNFLHSRAEILNWYGILPNAILITSNHDVGYLTTLVHNQFPQMFFVLTEVHPTSISGWINKDVWDFINKPKSWRDEERLRQQFQTMKSLLDKKP